MIPAPAYRPTGFARTACRAAACLHSAVTVLLDAPLWPRHGTLWGHLVSDASLAELHAFAERAGIPRRGFDLDHYDVPVERYDALVALGAVRVDGRELVLRLRASGLRVTGRERRGRRGLPPAFDLRVTGVDGPPPGGG